RVLERRHLREPSQVTLFACELRVEERVYQLARERDADDTAAEDEDVHAIVLDPLMRRVRVVTQSRADSRNPVGGDRGAHAAPAQNDAALGSLLADGGADGFGAIGIVDRI